MLLVDAILKRMGIEHPGDSVEHKFIDGKCMMRLKCCRSEKYKKQAIEEINKRLEEINKLINNNEFREGNIEGYQYIITKK